MEYVGTKDQIADVFPKPLPCCHLMLTLVVIDVNFKYAISKFNMA
jgi:hypothetical protein